MAKAKKKLIRVKKWPADEGNPYGYNKPQFAWMSPPVEGVRTQLTPFVYCREQVTAQAHAAMNDKRHNDFKPSEGYNFDKEKVRILIARDPKDFNEFRDKLFNAKAVMNVYEDIAGWDQSKITTVKHEIHDNVWLLTGPGGWLMSPQLISTFTFILRLGAEYGPFDVDGGIDSVERDFKALVSEHQGKDGHGDITRYLRSFRNEIYILLKYHKELFGKEDHKKLWAPKAGSSNIGVYGGMLSFCSTYGNNSDFQYKRLKKNFIKLCKEHLPRKK